MNKIILISGVAGTGKTTVAHKLCYIYDIAHRLGTGFIREVIKMETSNPCLNYHTYQPYDSLCSYDHLAKQTAIMLKSINACIDRASKEGTSLIIEGTHAIPWIINNTNVTHSFILYVDDRDTHYKMLNGKTHKTRKISNMEFDEIREMQEDLLSNAEIAKIPTIDTGRGELDIIEEIEKVVD